MSGGGGIAGLWNTITRTPGRVVDTGLGAVNDVFSTGKILVIGGVVVGEILFMFLLIWKSWGSSFDDSVEFREWDTEHK